MKQHRIETERLIMVPMTFKFTTKILKGDKTAYKDLGIKKGKGWPDADTIRILPLLCDRLSWEPTPDGFAAWLFIDKETKSIIGDGGFKGSPSSNGEIDLGYGIIESKRRQGYASEAVTGLVKWALSQPKVKVITADCLKTNVASLKVLQKAGLNGVRQDAKLVYFALTK